MQLSVKIKLTLAFIVQCLVLYAGLGFADFYRVFPVLPFVPIPFTPVTWPGACSQQTMTCVGNGTTVMTCAGGTADFKKGQGVYIPNGSTTACNIGGVACAQPVAPTVGVIMSSRLQACTDVTVSSTDGTGCTAASTPNTCCTGLGTGTCGKYVSAALCNFSPYQTNDTILVSNTSASGDSGFFKATSATATTLTVGSTITGEAAGASMNFQTTVPIGGGTVKIGNMDDDVGVLLDPDSRPFNQVDAVLGTAYGQHLQSIVANVGTYTFDAADEGKPVTILYRAHTPPTGSTVYSVQSVLRDGIQGGFSQASAAATVTTVPVAFPNFLHGGPMAVYAIPGVVAGAYAWDMWYADPAINSGVAQYQTRVWPNTTYVNTAVTLPTFPSCTVGGQANCLQVGSTLGFPVPNNTLLISGQTVTCTGVKADAFYGCSSSGSGTLGLGTPVISKLAPRLHVAYGGGLVNGQDPWSSENFPLGTLAPAAQGNDDFTPSAPPTISDISGKKVTLTAAVATGTWLVQHTDQNVLATIWQKAGALGDTINPPASCVTRYCQMPFDLTKSPSAVFTIQGAAGNRIAGTEFQSYCDGGGLNAFNAVETPGTGAGDTGLAIGAIGDPGHLFVRDVGFTATNAALSVMLNTSGPFFNECRLEDVWFSMLPISPTGASHSTAINTRLGAFVGDNVVTRYVDNPLMINGAMNGWNLRGTGSINQSLSAKLWHPMIGYAGSSFNGTMGPSSTLENPWTHLRPLDGNPGDILSDFTEINLYLGDIADWDTVNTPSHAPARGSLVDYGGSGGQFIGGFFGQQFPGVGGIYINGSSAGNHAALIDNNIGAGEFGILVDNAAQATIKGPSLTLPRNNQVGIECRGNCSVTNPTETIVVGITGTVGFRSGFKPDEATCNTTSSTDFNFHNKDLTFLATDTQVCSSAGLANITNDSGLQTIQGVQPVAAGSWQGAGAVGPLNSSNLQGTFTSKTAASTGGTMTWATGPQGTMTGTPNCLFYDITATPPVLVQSTTTAAPNSVSTVTYGSVGAHVYQWQCSWNN